jgi:hypothetical protein
MPHPAALARCQPDLRRIQQLVEGGVRQLHLGFDTLAPQQVAGGPVLDGVVEKRRLADSGLTTQNEHTAVRLGSPSDQAVDQGALGLPAVQHTVNAR